MHTLFSEAYNLVEEVHYKTKNYLITIVLNAQEERYRKIVSL